MAKIEGNYAKGSFDLANSSSKSMEFIGCSSYWRQILLKLGFRINIDDKFDALLSYAVLIFEIQFAQLWFSS